MNGTTPRTPTRVSGLLLCLAGLAVGCGEAGETRSAKWSYISEAIVQPGCATANCHSDLSQRSGVKLDDMRTGWDQLINRHFVIPSNPASSALIGLLNGQGTRRMPPDYALPKADIDLISAWITAGALYDGPGPAPALAASQENQ
jgi:hypothetical protein